MKRTKPLEATAYHEAGHAVASWHLGIRVTSATIVPEGTMLGSVSHADPLKGINIEYDNTPRATRRGEKAALVCLSGPAAEARFLGRRSHPPADDHIVARDILDHFAGTPEELEAYINLIAVRADDLMRLDHVWYAVTMLAEALLDRRTIAGKEVRAIVQQAISGFGTHALKPVQSS